MVKNFSLVISLGTLGSFDLDSTLPAPWALYHLCLLRLGEPDLKSDWKFFATGLIRDLVIPFAICR